MTAAASEGGVLLSGTQKASRLVPALWLGSSGRVLQWTEHGEVRLQSVDGEPLDLFEVVDGLRDTYSRIYLIDLEGLQHGAPQLDYVQELARDIELWVDAGVEDVDDAMDLIVAGAERVVLSTARLASAREVGRAWKLSQEIAVEIRFRNGRMETRSGDWPASPEEVASALRELGVGEIILGFYEAAIDWVLLQNLARKGSTWVLDSSEGVREELLGPSGAAGSIFSYPALPPLRADRPADGPPSRGPPLS